MTDRLIRTIKAISVKKKSEGEIGFLTIEEEHVWYNIRADEKILDGVLEKIIKKGNKVEFEMESGNAVNFKIVEEAKSSNGGDDDMVDFEQLLSKAHALKVPFSITTQCLKIDWEKKTAFFKAKISVYATDEQYKKYVIGDLSEESKHPVRMLLAEFEGHGDATEDNCGDLVKKHWIRMAETRAIVRALRWYTNNAKCAEEEK